MYKYIITWLLVTTNSVFLPNSTIQTQLGITNTMTTLGLNFETIKQKKEKVFDNKKDAINFYNVAKSYG